MKQIILSLIAVLCGCNLQGQKYPQFYVNHANDTLECEIINFSNKRVNLIANGEMRSMTPKKIKAFASFDGDKYRNFVVLKNDKKNFYEEEIVGKLSLYKMYTVYNREPTYVMVKNDKTFFLTILNFRSKTGKLVSDCEPVYELWRQKKFKISDPYSLVGLYNYYSKLAADYNGQIPENLLP